MLTDNFTNAIDMFLTPMTITPELCTISYECTTIDEMGESVSSITCDDLVTGSLIDIADRRRL